MGTVTEVDLVLSSGKNHVLCWKIHFTQLYIAFSFFFRYFREREEYIENPKDFSKEKRIL